MICQENGSLSSAAEAPTLTEEEDKGMLPKALIFVIELADILL